MHSSDFRFNQLGDPSGSALAIISLKEDQRLLRDRDVTVVPVWLVAK